MSGTGAGWGSSAYGGPGWSPRTATHADEIGTLWNGGLDSEWRPLKSVVLCQPGAEIVVDDVDAAQQLEAVDLADAQAEHEALRNAYLSEDIQVLEVGDVPDPTPNRMFCADLFVMTPEGAVLARPASTVRAGEEVAMSATLAAARVPILKSLTGLATFEGADLMWLAPDFALIGLGLRTNPTAGAQIGSALNEIGLDSETVDMPFGTMHLMGMLRIADRDLAIAWPRRTPHRAVEMLRHHGYRVEFLPVSDETMANRALNFVTLGPRRILMPAGNDEVRAWYESLGITVLETPMFELRKAAGAVGCLTGIVAREMG